MGVVALLVASYEIRSWLLTSVYVTYACTSPGKPPAALASAYLADAGGAAGQTYLSVTDSLS